MRKEAIATPATVQQALQRVGMKKTDVARRVGIDSATFSRFLCGRQALGGDAVRRISRLLAAVEEVLDRYSVNGAKL